MNFADCRILPCDRLNCGAENYMLLDSFDLNYQVLLVDRRANSMVTRIWRAKKRIYRGVD